MSKGIFLGLNTIDIQFLIEQYPEANTKTKAVDKDIHLGGPATNAAITYAFLGGEPLLLTDIGKNLFSVYIGNELAHYDVQFEDLSPEYNGLPTFASVLTSLDNGDRTIFSYHPDGKRYNTNMLNSIQLEDYQSVLLDGFHADISIALAKKARGYEIPVILDGGSWKAHTEALLPYVDMIICSDDFYPPGIKNKMEIFSFLESKFSIKKTAVSRGHQSILFSEDHKNIQEIPVKPVSAKDTLGAGDIFHGAFCYFFNEGMNFEDALLKASEVATFSCNYLGTKKWMEHYSHEHYSNTSSISKSKSS